MAEVSKNSSIIAIFSEFPTRYPRHFGLHFLLLVSGGRSGGNVGVGDRADGGFYARPMVGKPQSRHTGRDRRPSEFQLVSPFSALWVAICGVEHVEGCARGCDSLCDPARQVRRRARAYWGCNGTLFKARWEILGGSDHRRVVNTPR